MLIPICIRKDINPDMCSIRTRLILFRYLLSTRKGGEEGEGMCDSYRFRCNLVSRGSLPEHQHGFR